MNEYYRNALIVISASGGQDVHSGFLFHQVTRDGLHDELQNPEPARENLTGSVPLRIPGHFPDYSTSLLVDTVPQMWDYTMEPINKRAWTLQESVLPRRLLTFPMTGGLSMRCLEGGELAGEIVSNPYHEVPYSHSLGLISSSGRSGDELFKLWTNIVEDYVQRSLTHRSDILIAIGALAREFHTRNEVFLGRYLGGLWENQLRSGLLWHNTEAKLTPLPEQQSHYFAPSWSWASCPWRTVFENKPEMVLPTGEFTDDPEMIRMFTPRWYCEVLDCEVTLKSELDRFGALKAGVITIRGPLRPLKRQPNEGSDRAEADVKTQGCPELYLKEAWSAAEALILDRPLNPAGSTETEDEQYHWFGIWYAGRSRARGILVRQIDDTTFQRVGYAVYMVDEEEFPDSELHKERVIRLV